MSMYACMCMYVHTYCCLHHSSATATFSGSSEELTSLRASRARNSNTSPLSCSSFKLFSGKTISGSGSCSSWSNLVAVSVKFQVAFTSLTHLQTLHISLLPFSHPWLVFFSHLDLKMWLLTTRILHGPASNPRVSIINHRPHPQQRECGAHVLSQKKGSRKRLRPLLWE